MRVAENRCGAKDPTPWGTAQNTVTRETLQIVTELQNVLKTEDVACVVDAKHLCVNSRGIRDILSSTVTSEFGGVFKMKEKKREFLDYINLETDFNE